MKRGDFMKSHETLYKIRSLEKMIIRLFIDEKEFMDKLPETAKNAISDACTGSNPRQPSVEEMEKLLKCCYYDTEVDF